MIGLILSGTSVNLHIQSDDQFPIQLSGKYDQVSPQIRYASRIMKSIVDFNLLSPCLDKV